MLNLGQRSGAAITRRHPVRVATVEAGEEPWVILGEVSLLEGSAALVLGFGARIVFLNLIIGLSV